MPQLPHSGPLVSHRAYFFCSSDDPMKGKSPPSCLHCIATVSGASMDCYNESHGKSCLGGFSLRLCAVLALRMPGCPRLPRDVRTELKAIHAEGPLDAALELAKEAMRPRAAQPQSVAAAPAPSDRCTVLYAGALIALWHLGLLRLAALMALSCVHADWCPWHGPELSCLALLCN
jgi:hypothetical protein